MEGGSVVLNVETSTSSEALVSNWKLCLGDSYGAEGEEFEESPMCFQVECTNLQEKLNTMIDGYNRKLRLKNCLAVG